MITIKPLASSSKGNAYLIKAGGLPLLLEAGLPFQVIRERLWQEGTAISELAGCLVSHEHGDHAKAAIQLACSGINIFTGGGTRAVLLAKASRLPIEHRIHRLWPRDPIAINGWQVMPFETIHDAAEPLGFLIANGDDKIVYATDTAYIPVKFQGLTAIMVECNYSLGILNENHRTHPEVKNRVIRNHFGLDQVKIFLQANDLRQVREIWLLHLSSGNSDAAGFKKEIQALTGKPVYIAAE